jgi:hypothetical protein
MIFFSLTPWLASVLSLNVVNPLNSSNEQLKPQLGNAIWKLYACILLQQENELMATFVFLILMKRRKSRQNAVVF